MDTVTTPSSSCTCPSETRRSDDVKHPLDPLTAAEVCAAVQIVRNDPQYGAEFLFETIELLEPEKSVVRQYKSGEPINRTARVNLFQSKQDGIWRLTISLTQETRDDISGGRWQPLQQPARQDRAHRLPLACFGGLQVPSEASAGDAVPDGGLARLAREARPLRLAIVLRED